MNLQGFNDVLHYIEAHITETIAIDDLARCAMLSPYNLQKLFTVLTGIPLGEYIRRRKLSRSLFELLETKQSILDIALQYGYAGPDNYTKACKKYFGCTPSDIRAKRQTVSAFSKLSIHVQIKGGSSMNYRVEQLDAFQVVGVKESYASMDEGVKKIPAFWQQFSGTDKEQQLLKGASDDAMLGLCIPSEDTAYDYVIGVKTDNIRLSFESWTIPASKWLVFEAVGPVPTAIQQTTREIFESFLPSSQYEFTQAPDFERYPNGDVTAQDYVTEIWIPVK